MRGSLSPLVELGASITCIVEVQTMRCQGGLPSLIVKYSKGSPIIAVNYGLLITSYLWLAFSLLVSLIIWIYYPSIFTPDGLRDAIGSGWGLALIAGMSAYLGAITSVFMKANDYAKITRIDLSQLFWTGVLKPFIGVLFGIIIFSFFQTGLFQIADFKDNISKAINMTILLGFLSGFRERFAGDVLTRAESTLTKPGR
jgi:hypothetical protein